MNSLHQKLLQLLKEIDGICRKYNIVYYAAGGTTIGAVRHKGFIPWDDDADLYMTRDNFYKFREAVRKENPKDRVLECIDDNPEYPGTIPRYMDITTSIVAKYHCLNTCKAGILIDIFILDPVPNDKDAQQEHIGKLNLYADLVMPYYGYSHRSEDKYLDMYEAYKLRIEQEGREKIIKELERELFTHKEEECDYYILRWGTLSHIFEKSMFAEPIYFQYEDMQLALPQRWYDYLVQLYGPHWMYVPPHIEDEKHSFIVDTEHGYENYLIDAERFIEKDEAVNVYQRRKDLLIKREKYVRPLKNKLMKPISEYVLFGQKKYIEKENADVKRMFEEHRYKDIISLFNLYLKYQFSTLFIGAMRHSNIYRFNHKIFIPLNDEHLYVLVYSLLANGDLKKAKVLMDLRKKNKEMTVPLETIDKKIQNLFALMKAFYCKNVKRADELLMSFSEMDRHFIPDVFKISMGLLLEKDDKDCLEKAEEQLNNVEQHWLDNGEIIKLFGDLEYKKGNIEGAKKLYEEAVPKLTNGLYLLEIEEKIGVSANYDTPSRKGVPTELQAKQLELLSEIDKICTENQIKYFVVGRTLLHGYYQHAMDGGHKMNTIAMLPEDALKFIEAVGKCPSETRSIDYSLNNPRHSDHTIYYCDSQSLNFDWNNSDVSRNDRIHITIYILKRKHDRKYQWLFVRAMDVIRTIYYKEQENFFWKKICAFPIMKILGEKKVAEIVFKGYIKGAVGPSEKKFYLSKNNYKQSVGKQYKAAFFQNGEPIEIYGRIYNGPDEPELFLENVFGKYAKENVSVIEEKPSVLKIVDCNMTYSEFEKNVDISIVKDELWSSYKKGQAYSQELTKLNNKIRQYWNILLRGEDRIKLYFEYEPVKTEILQCNENGDFEKLEELLKNYDRKVRYYLNKGLGLCFDAEILEVYVRMLKMSGEGRLAARLLKKIPEEHKEKIEIV